MNKLLILNYHRLLDSDHENASAESIFFVHKTNFIEQLDLIDQLEIPIVSLQNGLKNNDQSKLSVVLTFDDGHASDYEIAYPILKERNIAATFFPVISTIGSQDRLTWNQILELSQNQFEIGSHTFSHVDLCNSIPEEIQFELEESKKIIEEKIGLAIESLALPFGKYSSEVKRIAEGIGYKNMLTTNGGTSLPDEVLLHRWNIKSTTIIQEFERILKGNSVTYFVKKSKSTLKRLIGNGLRN
ncbi:MAG: hypothetical protein COA38_14965 [Fluviicola sp.]|nr:MAG: hypothetical protein COA38_14965 [Fluviicola sp.]